MLISRTIADSGFTLELLCVLLVEGSWFRIDLTGQGR